MQSLSSLRTVQCRDRLPVLVWSTLGGSKTKLDFGNILLPRVRWGGWWYVRGDRKDKSSVFIFFCSSPFKSSEGKRAIKIPVKIAHICNIGLINIPQVYWHTRIYRTGCNGPDTSNLLPQIANTERRPTPRTTQFMGGKYRQIMTPLVRTWRRYLKSPKINWF